MEKDFRAIIITKIPLIFPTYPKSHSDRKYHQFKLIGFDLTTKEVYSPPRVAVTVKVVYAINLRKYLKLLFMN